MEVNGAGSLDSFTIVTCQLQILIQRIEVASVKDHHRWSQMVSLGALLSQQTFLHQSFSRLLKLLPQSRLRRVTKSCVVLRPLQSGAALIPHIWVAHGNVNKRDMRMTFHDVS